MKLNRESIDKSIVYSTGVLFLDIIVGNATINKPFHEALGVTFPEYLNRIDQTVLALGWGYSISVPRYKNQSRKLISKS